MRGAGAPLRGIGYDDGRRAGRRRGFWLGLAAGFAAGVAFALLGWPA